MSINLSTQPVPDNESDCVFDINYRNVKKAEILLRSVNHKLRYIIIKTIYQNKKITVTQLYGKLRLGQATTSQHLAFLRRAGIVATEQKGRFVFYKINFSRIEELNVLVKNLIGN